MVYRSRRCVCENDNEEAAEKREREREPKREKTETKRNETQPTKQTNNLLLLHLDNLIHPESFTTTRSEISLPPRDSHAARAVSV